MYYCNQTTACGFCGASRPASLVLGQGIYFDALAGNFVRDIASGDLAPTPDSPTQSANITVPLNVFDPLKNVGSSGNALVVRQSGLYELTYYAGVEFDQAAQIVAVYVADGDGAPVSATWSQWYTGGTPTQTVSKTALVCLKAGTQLRLVVRTYTTGRLVVSPKALLALHKLGSC